MGYASRNNPTAQAAKRGELPQKEKPMSKREWEAKLTAMIEEKTGINQLRNAMGITNPY